MKTCLKGEQVVIPPFWMKPLSMRSIQWYQCHDQVLHVTSSSHCCCREWCTNSVKKGSTVRVNG